MGHLAGFAEKAMVTALHAPDGDFRDWAEIEAWGHSIANELRATHHLALTIHPMITRLGEVFRPTLSRRRNGRRGFFTLSEPVGQASRAESD